jgi:cell division protein ZipA
MWTKPLNLQRCNNNSNQLAEIYMLKDWIIILGTLFIIVIVIDGIRRKRNDRYGKIRMSSRMKKRIKDEPEESAEPQPSYVSELPNGGARVIGHRDPSDIVEGLIKRSSSIKEKKNQERPANNTQQVKPQAAKPARPPQQTYLNLDESVPLLMESVDDNKSSERIEPHFSNEDIDDENAQHNNFVADERDYDDELDADGDVDSEYDADAEYDSDEYDTDSEYDEDDADYDEPQEEEEAKDESTQFNEPEEVLVVHVMAKDHLLKGAELLDTVLQCGMRYGHMDIFHRYTSAKGDGAHLFSMANMVKPGTFDLDAMEQFETPGVSFFMTLPIDADSMQSFDLMIDTARTLAGTLGGELKDDQRSVMTKQTLEHCRERIRNYERQRLFRRPK